MSLPGLARPFGILALSEGWEKIYNMGVLPLQHSVEGRGAELNTKWGANKFIMVYDLVFKMCIQRDPWNYSEQIYKKYCQSVATYVSMGEQKLREAKKISDRVFLDEFYLRWTRFSVYISRMTKVFGYLDRFYTPNSMVRSTYAEGTFQFSNTILVPFIDIVLRSSAELFTTADNQEDLNSVRFALAALIDACLICDTCPADMLKILTTLRAIWSTKTSAELLAVLPPFFKGGLVDMIVDYTSPDCFLERSSHSLTEKGVHCNGSGAGTGEGSGAATGNGSANESEDEVLAALERRRRVGGRGGNMRLSYPRAVRIGGSNASNRSSSGGEGRRANEMRALLKESFVSVMGEEQMDWTQNEDECKAVEPPNGLLLVRHAKELHALKTMGFTDRRRNLEVLRWTWGNLKEAISVLSPQQGDKSTEAAQSKKNKAGPKETASGSTPESDSKAKSNQKRTTNPGPQSSSSSSKARVDVVAACISTCQRRPREDAEPGATQAQMGAQSSNASSNLQRRTRAREVDMRGAELSPIRAEENQKIEVDIDHEHGRRDGHPNDDDSEEEGFINVHHNQTGQAGPQPSPRSEPHPMVTET